MSGGLVLGLGVAAALGTLLAVVRVRRPVPVIAVTMMVGWLVSELAVFHLVLQVAVAGVAVATGALGAVSGAVGVGLLMASAVGLAGVQWRASRAAAGFLETVPRERIDTESVGRGGPWNPFRFDERGLEVVRDVAYGEHPKRHRLDLYHLAGPAGGRPVAVYVHGGGWTIGHKRQQGRPLLLHLARHGYLAVSINYRLAPRHRWPAQIVDVKRALAWIHTHAAEHGGDPSFLAIAGGSAGGHLTALAAVTVGDPSFQPGFEDADTTVSAAVPIYAPFDLTDRAGIRGRSSLRWFLERLVMPTRLRDDRSGWEAASPQHRIHPGMPPLLVVQGTLDNLVWREEARRFVEDARAVATAPVVYAEVPGAHHAFDVFNSVRTAACVEAIGRFLETVRAGGPGREPLADRP